MADGTKIEWTDATWNVVNGCSVVSPGCTNCYAMRLAGTRLKHHASRAGLTVDNKAGPVWTGETRFNEPVLLDPLKWRRPRLEAARHEVDLRARKYPALVASGKLTADEATVDYQAWTCILDWFETGQMRTIAAGGADERTIVDWALAEDAAAKARDRLLQDAQALMAALDGQTDPAKKAVMQARCDKVNARVGQVRAIARTVSLRRQSIEAINRQLREQERKAA